MTPERFEAAREPLLAWARARGRDTEEEVRTLTCNGPSVPLAQRYHEVQLRVVSKDV